MTEIKFTAEELFEASRSNKVIPGQCDSWDAVRDYVNAKLEGWRIEVTDAVVKEYFARVAEKAPWVVLKNWRERDERLDDE